MKIEYTENLAKEIEDKINDGLGKYEEEKGVDLNYKKYAFVLRGETGEVIGGLTGYTVFKEVCVDNLWIDKSSRGSGSGKNLLGEVEKHFAGKGLNNINLITNAFQAPKFYEKCGFELEFIRKNKKNPKLDKYFFIKRFKD